MSARSYRWHFSAAVALAWPAALIAIDQISRHAEAGDEAVVYIAIWLPSLLCFSLAAWAPVWRVVSLAHHLLSASMAIVVANALVALALTVVLHEPAEGNQRFIWAVTSAGSFVCMLAAPVILAYLLFDRFLGGNH